MFEGIKVAKCIKVNAMHMLYAKNWLNTTIYKWMYRLFNGEQNEYIQTYIHTISDEVQLFKTVKEEGKEGTRIH